MHVCDGATYLVALFFLLKIRAGTGRQRTAGETRTRRNYGFLWRAHKPFLAFLGLLLLLYALSYGQLESGLPAYVGQVGLPSATMAVAFAVNAVTVMLVQTTVGARIARLEATTASRLAGVVWALVWLTLAICAYADSRLALMIALPASLALFAVGEVLVSGALPAMVNSLATDADRGQFNATYSISISCGLTLGPLLAGYLLSRSGPATVFIVLFIGCLTVSSIMSSRVAPAYQRNYSRPSTE